MKNIHLIVSCSLKKTLPETKTLSFHRIRGRKIETRLDEWGKLADEATTRVSANTLYHGQYWHSIRRLIDRLEKNGSRCKVSIISAGFGILRETDKLPSYSATFQSNVPETIVPSDTPSYNQYRKDWLKQSTETFWGLRRCSLLKSRSKNSLTVSLLSPVYLEAVREQLTQISPSQLLVFATTRRDKVWFEDSIVPLNSDLQQHLGGSRVSLGVRMAQSLLEAKKRHTEITPLKANAYFEKLAVKHGNRIEYDRQPISDDFGRSFISKRVRSGVTTYTPILRELRESGYACEMKRFRSLFKEIIA
jgi:hypothetical protein